MNGGSLFSGIKYTALAQFGSLHRHLSDVKLQQAKRFIISAGISSAESEPIPYQLDGDPGGKLPVEVEIVEKRLSLITNY